MSDDDIWDRSIINEDTLKIISEEILYSLNSNDKVGNNKKLVKKDNEIIFKYKFSAEDCNINGIVENGFFGTLIDTVSSISLLIKGYQKNTASLNLSLNYLPLYERLKVNDEVYIITNIDYITTNSKVICLDCSIYDLDLNLVIQANHTKHTNRVKF